MLEVIKLDRNSHKIVFGYIRTSKFNHVTLQEYRYDTLCNGYFDRDDDTLTRQMLELIDSAGLRSPAHRGYLDTYRACMSEWLEGTEPFKRLTLCLVPYTMKRVPKGCLVAIQDGIITSVEVTYS